MPTLPVTEDTLLLRTDYSDQATWDEVRDAMLSPSPDFGFQAYVEGLYDRISVETLVAANPPDEANDERHSFFFIVDDTTIAHAEHPILCVDLFDEPGRTFRIIPSEPWAVENNLAVGNMSFDEFAAEVDADGILRGLDDPYQA